MKKSEIENMKKKVSNQIKSSKSTAFFLPKLENKIENK